MKTRTKTRTGTFSSSKNYKLMANGRAKGSIGAPFYNYVNEKLQEKKTGRPLQKDHSARSTTWGQFVEQFAFDRVHWKYELVSKKRYFHKSIENFSGMPDFIDSKKKVVGDIKCPWTLKSFCDVVDAMEIAKESDYAKTLKSTKKEYYWQLVSNAILTDSDKALFVLYVPYFEDLEEIKDKAQNLNPEEYHKFGWINWADDAELPFLIKGMHYKNIYEYEFEIPKEDKKAMIDRLKLANQIVNEAGY